MVNMREIHSYNSSWKLNVCVLRPTSNTWALVVLYLHWQLWFCIQCYDLIL